MMGAKHKHAIKKREDGGRERQKESEHILQCSTRSEDSSELSCGV